MMSTTGTTPDFSRLVSLKDFAFFLEQILLLFCDSKCWIERERERERERGLRIVWALGIILLVFARSICCSNENLEASGGPLQVDLTLIPFAGATGAGMVQFSRILSLPFYADDGGEGDLPGSIDAVGGLRSNSRERRSAGGQAGGDSRAKWNWDGYGVYLSAPLSSMAATAAISVNLESLPDDILLHILSLLDGPSLAAVGCSSSHLHRLSSHPSLWLSLCLSTYPSLLLLPSLPFSPRSFFSLAFPFPSSSPIAHPSPDLVFSFVDLRHRGAPILSRIITTDTRSPSFLSSPFRLNAIDGHLRPDPAFSPADLELSWVMVDRTGDRVVDLSSWKPVSVETNWFSGDARVRFATFVGEGRAAVVAAAMCSAVGVRELGLMVEDADGVPMNGMLSMAIIGKMMDGERKGRRRREGLRNRR